jgi:transposase-like protein
MTCHTRHMHISASTDRYRKRRFPVEIISHCVWLYDRFCLSCRDVEELLFARGVPRKAMSRSILLEPMSIKF